MWQPLPRVPLCRRADCGWEGPAGAESLNAGATFGGRTLEGSGTDSGSGSLATSGPYSPFTPLAGRTAFAAGPPRHIPSLRLSLSNVAVCVVPRNQISSTAMVVQMILPVRWEA